MTSRLPFIQKRLELNLSKDGTDVVLYWVEIVGGALDPTGAIVSGTETLMSGTMKGFVHAEPAKSVVRQFAEIEAGDLIVDLGPSPDVTLLSGTGKVSLDSISSKGPRFQVGGELYVQKEIGDKLGKSWDVILRGQKLSRTLLLRKA